MSEDQPEAGLAGLDAGFARCSRESAVTRPISIHLARAWKESPKGRVSEKRTAAAPNTSSSVASSASKTRPRCIKRSRTSAGFDVVKASRSFSLTCLTVVVTGRPEYCSGVGTPREGEITRRPSTSGVVSPGAADEGRGVDEGPPSAIFSAFVHASPQQACSNFTHARAHANSCGVARLAASLVLRLARQPVQWPMRRGRGQWMTGGGGEQGEKRSLRSIAQQEEQLSIPYHGLEMHQTAIGKWTGIVGRL